jgi:hypothetical protein
MPYWLNEFQNLRVSGETLLSKACGRVLVIVTFVGCNSFHYELAPLDSITFLPSSSLKNGRIFKLFRSWQE